MVLQAVAGFAAKGFEATDVCEGDKAVFTNTSTVAAGRSYAIRMERSETGTPATSTDLLTYLMRTHTTPGRT